MTDIEKAIAFLVETKLGSKKLRDKELSNVCDISIKAIEKQIPKEPSCKKYSNEPRCPVCNERTCLHSKYCIFCGQALDWSDEE